MLWYSGFGGLESYDPEIRGDQALEFDGFGLLCYPCRSDITRSNLMGVNVYCILDDREHAMIIDISTYQQLMLDVMDNGCNILYGEDAETEYAVRDIKACYQALRDDLIGKGFDRVDIHYKGSHMMSYYLRFPPCSYHSVEYDMG